MIRILTGALCLLCLIQGAANAYQVYFANLHAHTALSDGIGTPEEAYAYARDIADIDVLALTEHTHLLTSSEWNHLLNAAAAHTQPGIFVALGAQEFGNLNDFGHLGIYDTVLRNPNETENLLGSYQFMLDMGAVGNFNHPNPIYGSNFNDLAYYPEYESVMISIEIRNGLRADDYEPQYLQALRNGWRIGPFGNQDNHEGHWGDQQNWNSGGQIYLTGILADELSAPAILEALRARRFFAMEVDPPSDRIGLAFYANGSPMGSRLSSGTHLDLTGAAWALNGTSLFNRVDLLRDGEVVDSRIQIGAQIDWSFTQVLTQGESHYYFVRVTQVDGDRAWSSPVWVEGEVDPASAWPDSRALGCKLRVVPNPVADHASFEASVPESDPTGSRLATLEIRDLQGRRVARLPERILHAGTHRWGWNPRGEGRLPAGIYAAILRIDGREAARCRLVLVP